MLVRRDLGFPSLVFLVLVVVVPVFVLIVRRKWRHSVERSEEIKRLVVSASEELARAEFEAREAYYYSVTATPSDRVSVSASASTYASVSSGSPLKSQYGSPLKPQYQCAVCFCPTTTRCAKCKAVRYCSGKCQIIHWRQGHKFECHPYVAASPTNGMGGSSYHQGDRQDHNDDFDTNARQTATPAGRYPENLHHKDDVRAEAHAHRQGTSSISESNSLWSDDKHSVSSTSTKFSASVMFENLETVKSAHKTPLSPARKSTDLGRNGYKKSNLSDADAQSGISSSSGWTDSGSNESSLSEPSTNSSGFWDGTIRKKKPSIDEPDDFTPGSLGEVSKGFMANHTTKGGYNSNVMNGFIAAKVIDGSGQTGSGSKKSDDGTHLSKDMVNEGSKFRKPPTATYGMLSHGDADDVDDLPTSNCRESENSSSGSSPQLASVAAGHTRLKDDRPFHGLPSYGPERLIDGSSNSSVSSPVSRSREVGSSLSRASDTTLTSTKLVNVDDDNHKVTPCSYQFTENSRSVRSGMKISKSKFVDQLKPSKLSRQDLLEQGNETTQRYGFKGLFPYDMFVKLYNWKNVELQPCGLKNCGNSCYANAVLQCLVYTPPLTAYLLEGLHSKACDKRGWCVTCELEGLVIKAKYANSPLSPIRILTHIENIGSNLGHGKEEDAHEFLRYAIEALQLVCIKEAGTIALSPLEEETTLIGLTFGGYLRSKINCMKCGGKSERHERMMDLTVEIEGNIRTLEEALDKFTGVEILDGENKYKCSRCKSYEKAKKKLTLLEAPNVLTIALKRFQSGKFGKLNKPIHFPEILDMAPYVSGTSDKSPIYRLYGVVVHVDTMNSSFSGHYVCYIKNAQNHWFKFDDSVVKEVDLQHVLKKGAYILLYARCSPRAPRSIRNSLIQQQDPRKHKMPTSFISRPHPTEPWDGCNFHPPSQPNVRHRSLEEESSSSSDNSGFFSESCSCSTDSTHRDISGIDDHISGDLEHDYWNSSSNSRNVNVNSSDSDTSSSSSFPSPLPSRLSQLYSLRRNGGSCVRGCNGEDDDKGSKECRNLDCSCSSCRVTNLDRLGSKAGVTFRKSMNRS